MRAWPARLAARLKNAPPIGLQFFVWRELTQPGYFSLWDEERPRVEEPVWSHFQKANEGRLAEAIRGWERWGQLTGDIGRFRFFGYGNPAGVDESLREIRVVLSEVDATITEYQQLPVEPWRQWQFGNQIRVHPHGHRLTDWLRAFGQVSLSVGYNYEDGHKVLVQEEGADKFTAYDEEFIHEPWDGVRIAVDVYALQDFSAGFARAVKRWVPEGLEDTPEPVKEEPPSTKSKSPHLFHYDKKNRHWYLRYPGDEDGDFGGRKEMDYGGDTGLHFYATLLRSPWEPFTADDFYEIDWAELGEKFLPDEITDKEGFDTAYKAFDLLTDKIKEAREEKDLEEVRRLQIARNKLQDAMQATITDKGKSRVFEDANTSNPHRAAERVMRLAILKLNQNKMPRLARYLQKYCPKLRGERLWRYEPPTEIPWEF